MQDLTTIPKVEILEPLVRLEPELVQACQELERAWRQLYPVGAKPYVIQSAEENAKAQQLQATAAELRKRLEAKKKEASEPYNAAIKTIREIVAGYSDPVQACLDSVTPAMSRWFVEEKRRSDEEQRKINEKTARENQRAQDRAEVRGQEPPPPKLAPIVAAPAKSIDLGDVKQTMRDNWVYKIIGVSESEWGGLRRNDPRTKGIPDALFLLDTATLSRQARGSKGVNPYDGTPIIFVNEPVPANRK